MSAPSVVASDALEIIEDLGEDRAPPFWLWHSLPHDAPHPAIPPTPPIQLLRGARILLSGSRGFLGRYFTHVFELIAQQQELRGEESLRVVALDSLISSGEAGLLSHDYPHVRFAQCDVSNVEELHDKLAISKGPFTHVIHAAGIASPYWYKQHPLKTLDVSYQGTLNMLDEAHRAAARFLYFSSSEIYGNPEPTAIPTHESYPGRVSSYGERSMYDEGKRVGEALCYSYGTQYNVHASIVRPFNVYGPGMQQTDYRVMPNFASCWVHGKHAQVYADGQQTRTYCYITDAMMGFLRVMLLGKPGPYNIGVRNPEIGVGDLAQKFSNVVEGMNHKDGERVRSLPAFTQTPYPSTYPADEPLRRCPDITKATIDVGYRPQVDLSTGLERFLRWAEVSYK